MRLGPLAVIDTNVILVANQQHADISPEGVIACVTWLEHLQEAGSTVLDDNYEILREYSLKTSPNTGNRVGDVFLKWLFQNIGNPQRVIQVHIKKHPQRGYSEFPDDPGLQEFDPEDRKFVAVAAVHSKRPPILQGSDSKWLEWSEKLASNGIRVEFLCPKDVARFIERKRS